MIAPSSPSAQQPSSINRIVSKSTLCPFAHVSACLFYDAQMEMQVHLLS